MALWLASKGTKAGYRGRDARDRRGGRDRRADARRKGRVPRRPLTTRAGRRSLRSSRAWSGEIRTAAAVVGRDRRGAGQRQRQGVRRRPLIRLEDGEARARVATAERRSRCASVPAMTSPRRPGCRAAPGGGLDCRRRTRGIRRPVGGGPGGDREAGRAWLGRRPLRVACDRWRGSRTGSGSARSSCARSRTTRTRRYRPSTRASSTSHAPSFCWRRPASEIDDPRAGGECGAQVNAKPGELATPPQTSRCC